MSNRRIGYIQRKSHWEMTDEYVATCAYWYPYVNTYRDPATSMRVSS